jgi:O-antigen ligase
LIVVTVVAAFALSFSRTSIGSLFILICAGAGLFNNMKKFSGYLLLVVLLVLVIAPLLPIYDVHEMTFLGKVQNSFSEISFTDDSDMTKAIANWRGFEAFRAYVGFINASLPQQIIGRGWGATVDLGLAVQMSEDMNFQYLPILHNGYMHILTKYGLLGVFLYFVFLWRVTIGSRKYFIKKNNLTYAWLISGIGLVLAYTSLVITGILNKSGLDATLIILGLLFSYASQPLENSPPISATRRIVSPD